MSRLPEGCRCVILEQGLFEEDGPRLVDMTDCPLHPLTCEALHPETGVGCHHGPGHPGDHGYMVSVQWPNRHGGDSDR